MNALCRQCVKLLVNHAATDENQDMSERLTNYKFNNCNHIITDLPDVSIMFLTACLLPNLQIGLHTYKIQQNAPECTVNTQ